MSLEINTDDFWKELDQRVLDARTERKLFIEEITKLREQVAAQAAVIEKLRTKLSRIPECEWWEDARGIVEEALALPTNSTQILDEVRRAERERAAQYIENQSLPDCYSEPCLAEFAEEIRAME